MAVADGRHRLDAEKESVRERPGRHLGDAVSTQGIQDGEENIDGEIGARDEGGKLRPAQRQDPMIGITPFAFPGIDLEEFKLANVNDHAFGLLFLHPVILGDAPISGQSLPDSNRKLSMGKL